MSPKQKLFQGAIDIVFRGTHLEAIMIPTKIKTPLTFTWIDVSKPGKPRLTVTIGQYTLICFIRDGAWLWEITRQRSTTLVLPNHQTTIPMSVARSKETGWRRQSTAQHQAELYYHKNYGKTST